jgi:hypothetical protein
VDDAGLLLDREVVYLVTLRMVRNRPHNIVKLPRGTAVCAMLLLATGCPKRPEFGMEAPGRPAVTWQHDDTGTTEKPMANADRETERVLLEEYRE